VGISLLASLLFGEKANMSLTMNDPSKTQFLAQNSIMHHLTLKNSTLHKGRLRSSALALAQNGRDTSCADLQLINCQANDHGYRWE